MLDREYELLKKYERGRVLDKEDEYRVYTLASIGLARIGFTELERRAQETARLTPLAQRILSREKIMRNPIKRFFYQLANI